MKEPQTSVKHASSFRDPSGFLFCRDGVPFRQVNIIYKDDYDHLMNSGLYQTLAGAKLLIPHDEVEMEGPQPDKVYKVIRPELIPFISYPYEWSFSQLKHAALLTLEIQRKSLEFGMTLKDCSAYNVQFRGWRPLFIDTLSFARYREGQPWVAYRQFCQHFLAPLALMKFRDVRLNRLLRLYIDGVPLDLASSLLPLRTRFSFSLAAHIILHARSQKYFANKRVDMAGHRMSRLSFVGLIENLESAVKKLKWRPQKTGWPSYYDEATHSPDMLHQKKQLVAEFLDKIRPKVVWDLGANTGMFSRLASERGALTISFDSDPACVERNYLQCIERCEENILPLLLDLTNPSPAVGWLNQERMSLLERGPADTALCLALIHHLALSNNVPLDRVADFLQKICKSLIIEFVPKSDPQAQRLLTRREDLFPDYTQEEFEKEFGRFFTIHDCARPQGSERTLYLMSTRRA